jgi:succinate dehydrogenase/fumarate reductase flavoprotein subunit
MNMKETMVETDVLVIGGGGAGLRAALEAERSGARVAVVAKGKLGSSGCTAKSVSELSAYSCSLGHADPRDTPYLHFRDTVDQGRKCANQRLVRILAQEAPKRFLEIVEMGGRFRKVGDKYEQFLADASTLPRACHNGADTGREIASTLMKACQKRERIIQLEDILITKLLSHQGTVVGAFGLDLKHETFVTLKAKSTVLATGGGGQIFSLNAQPVDITGEGLCMAYDAGAELVNMEFIQIGPALVHPIKGYLLVTRFWRLNPRLTNGRGESFLSEYLPSGLSERDVIEAKQFAFPFIVGYPAMHLDIAMHKEIKEGRGTEHGGVYLDVSHNRAEEIEKMVPVTFQWLLERGIDIRKQPVEVAPVVQCFIGGVKFDEKGRTNLPGLFVCGEVGGGEHGAARPGGNLLAGSQVFGAIAGQSAAGRALAIETVRLEPGQAEEEKKRLTLKITGEKNADPVLDQVRKLLWDHVSVVRREESLRETLAALRRLKAEVVPKLGASDFKGLSRVLFTETAIDLGLLVTLAALLRSESRGTHYREDLPQTDHYRWNRVIQVRKSGNQTIASLIDPVEIDDFYREEEVLFNG